MDLELKNKVVLVSGSSRGIGLAIAAAFLKENARVVITGRSDTSLNEAKLHLSATCPEQSLMAIRSDMTIPNEIERVMSEIRLRYDKIDHIVANVGYGSGKAGWQLSADDWTKNFEINFFGAMSLSRAAIPDLEQSMGSITFISSITGVESTPAPLPYSAAKAALVNSSKNLARQLGQKNIRVNVVAPGNILFAGGSWDRKRKERRDTVENYIHDEVPLRRFGTPEEIADVVVFLASARASFLTGACIVVDGGQTRSY